jgi:hypothetical protein
MDFSRAFSFANIVAGSARAGAQWGYRTPANAGDSTGIATAARADANNLAGLNVASNTFCACTSGGPQISCTATCSGTAVRRYLQVDTDYNFQTLIAYPGVPQSMVLRGRATLRVE